jgi:hypothetical protein
MARSVLSADPSAAPDTAADRGRMHRAGRNIKILLGLLAIYGPVALVFAAHRGALGKAYLLLAIWAVEGIVWYWHDGHDARRERRRGHPGEAPDSGRDRQERRPDGA